MPYFSWQHMDSGMTYQFPDRLKQAANDATDRLIDQARRGWSDGMIMASLLETVIECVPEGCRATGEVPLQIPKGFKTAESMKGNLTKALSRAGVRGPRYLDIGCAEGQLTDAIAKVIRAKSVIGADILEAPPPAMWELVVRGKARYVKLDGTKLPFGDGKFELVTCNLSMHHIERVNELLAEIHRVLAKGGVLSIREHHCANAQYAAFLDFSHFTRDVIMTGKTKLREGSETEDFEQRREASFYRSQSDWKKLIESAGFEQVTSTKPSGMFELFHATFVKVG